MRAFILLCACFFATTNLGAQSFMMNPYGCAEVQALNGRWNAIVDIFGKGEAMKFYLNRKPAKDTDIVEYAFGGGLTLEVPGDFNSQSPELKYYEGNVWYQRTFAAAKNPSRRQFLYFAGVSYEAAVWLNGVLVGRHEGGFTPFEFEITRLLKDGVNDLVVMVNNSRRIDGIPAMVFDWWNYGGILRDVLLVERPQAYVQDYVVQLKRGQASVIAGRVKVAGATKPQQVTLSIPELSLHQTLATDERGDAAFEVEAKPQLWEPASPRTYAMTISMGDDQVRDEIAFRTIETRGTDILLNGKPVFLKGVNVHEEIPQRMGRAHSDADAAAILKEVKALGCNFVRTAHYPQNERIGRAAEKAGVMIWEEIPIWQGIEFSNPVVLKKAETMLREMIYRDKNRGAIIIWSIANETRPSEFRDKVLTELVALTRKLDATRLVGAAFDNIDYDQATSTFTLKDRVADAVDVVGVNRYLGWYKPFPADPKQLKWNVAPNQPMIFSEFGGEAFFGRHGSPAVAHSWSEEYQEELYRKNLVMFRNVPNLRGTTPWVLFDFRSPTRMHPQNQDGWNRKGLLSDQGQRKKAWYVMKAYYDSIAK